MKAYINAAINAGIKSGIQLGSNSSVPVLHPPLVSLPTQTAISDVSATVGATLDCNGLETVWSIEYGATTEYGSTQAGGTTSENGAKTVSLTGLTQNTTIHWRFKAVNADGTAYSTDQSITTINTELITYISGLVTPLSESQKAKLNTFISSLKSGLSISNLSDVFDVMYLLAGETSESSLKNIIKNQYHATAINAPVFETLKGFTGNGTSSCIDSNFNPSTNSIRYTLNNAGMGIYSMKQLASASTYSCGSLSGTNASMIGVRRDADNPRYFLNNSSSVFANPSSGGITTGMFSMYRNSSTEIYAIHNDGIVSTKTASSIAIPNSKLFILAYGNSNSPVFFDSIQASFFFLGKSLSSSQNQVVFNAIENYLNSGLITINWIPS